MDTDNIRIYTDGMFSTPNMTYSINNVIDLDNNVVTLGENIVLKFDNGGGIINGTLVGNATTIDATPIQIFNSAITLSGVWTNGYLLPQWFGAIANGKNDCTEQLQQTIDTCYNIQKEVYLPSGTYIVTRSLFIYDGISLRGDGIYNTIIKTPFGKSDTAKSLLNPSKGEKQTITDYNGEPFLDFDYSIGHNRFYIGDGNVGYYDADRATNPNHPLYWPNDGSTEWSTWNNQRLTIQSQGRFVGKTGREGYGQGVIKSSQNPNIFYPTKGQQYFKQNIPGGHIHSGIRNIKISNLQINTNSSDRGKDSAINLKYIATDIPANIRDTYDSSVLNCYFENLYLFSIGKDALSATRAVDWTVTNVYMRQCAETGLNLEGVTSIFVTGCYANSCLENGYRFKGVNYSTINGCASDSCGVGYNLRNCSGVSLISCGAEATRYTAITEEEKDAGAETLYHGRAFQIVNCKGVTLTSPYTMTSHLKDPNQAFKDNEEGSEDFDPLYLQSRHVFINNSQDVAIINPYFKAFQRIRTTPYRDANNNKVNCNGGTYDSLNPNSRYWQIQNYLVGAQYEIRGESSTHKVSIIANRTVDELQRESEIRTNNLDIYDPGTVPNPLLSRGYSTAKKMLSGRDGNGGWTYVQDGETHNITINNFEFIFPINAKSNYGTREYFWKWRNSLKLVRIITDTEMLGDIASEHGDDVAEARRERCYGYLSLFNDGNEFEEGDYINWDSISSADWNKFSIDIINDNYYKFIDGSKKLYSFGAMFVEDATRPTFIPKIHTTIPAHVRTSIIGCRTILNDNEYKDLPNAVAKASVSIVGNADKEHTWDISAAIANNIIEESELISGEVLALYSKNVTDDENPRSLFGVYKKDATQVFGVTDSNEGIITSRGHKFLSTKATAITNITKLAQNASTQLLVNKVNQILDRLQVQGLMLPEEEIEDNIEFILSEYASSDTSLTIDYIINSTVPIYDVGAAYSSSNTVPTTNNGSVYTADLVSNVENVYTGTLVVPRNSASTNRYIRMCVELAQTHGASTRQYDTNVYFWSGNTVINNT